MLGRVVLIDHHIVAGVVVVVDLPPFASAMA
jgi:hypothetical protein